MTASKKSHEVAKTVDATRRPSFVKVGVVAALLLTTSTAALHAQDRDLQKELDQLKAQINSLKSAINEQRSETRKNREKIKVVADRSIAPPLAPPGYTGGGFQPIGGFDDKKLHFGGITITPGGFFAAEGVFRSKTTQADILTGFNNIPLGNSSLAQTNETRFTARQSRFAMLVEGAITPSILGSGYVEADFLGSGLTSNNNQSDSYIPRIRNLYANLDFNDSGFHVLAGQNWSLLTLNSKGITPRNEVAPPQIDAGFIPGFIYARQPQIRLTKDFDKKLWLSVSAENPQTTFAGVGAGACQNVVTTTPASTAALAAGSAVPALGLTAQTVPAGVANLTCLSGATGGGFAGNGLTQQLSLNHIPDIAAKAAYEAKIADRDIHIEGVGMYRNFYDEVNYGTLIGGGGGGYTGGSSAPSKSGYIVGGSVIVPLLPKRLDFQVSGYTGKGIGRYTSSGLPDATLGSNGSISPIRGQAMLAGLTFHVTPTIDLWAFGGFEQLDSNYYNSGTAAAPVYNGYGIPNANDSGCNTVGGTCAGQTHRVYQITGGVWDKIYQGPFGYFRAGIQYSYTKRQLFDGVNAGGAFVGSPSTDDHMILTSLRYYPF